MNKGFLLASLIPVVFIAALVDSIQSGRLYHSRPTRSAERATVPILQIAGDKLSFGETWESERFEWTLPVENRGPSTVTVSRVTASCSCIAASPQQFSIDPGQSREVRLVIDLRGNGLRRDGVEAFRVAVEFTFRFDPGHSPVEKVERFDVTGRVKKAIAAPPALYLGDHSELAETIPPATFEVDARTRLKSLSATSTRPDIRVEKQTSEVTGTRYAFQVSFSSHPAKGPVEGAILLDAVTEDGIRLPAKTIRLLGAVVNDIQPEPLEILLAGRRVGELSEQDFQIRSLTGREVKLVEIRTEGKGLEIMEVGRKACEFTLKQHILDVGLISNKVHVIAKSEGRVYRIAIPVITHGTEASK